MADNYALFRSGPAIPVMNEYFKENLQATDEELQYMSELSQIKFEINSRSSAPRLFYSSPSVVLDDFLYHGDLGHACNMELLQELGIRHIINVCDCQLDSTIQDNFHVLWINIDDTMKVDIKKYFDQTNEFIRKCKEMNEKVLVHCQMGISRSSSIVLAYLMKYHHNTLREAYTHLIERRRIASPNSGFFIQLIRYEKELLAQKEIDVTKPVVDEKNPVEPIYPPLDPVEPADEPSESENTTF